MDGSGKNKKIIIEQAQDGNLQTDNKVSSKEDSNAVKTGAVKTVSLADTTYMGDNGKEMLKDPDSIIVLVNKKRNLSSDWVPSDLVVPNVTFAFKEDSPRKLMRKEGAKALEELFSGAKKDNISILATSGYRSYDTQKRIFENNAKLYGEKTANKTSAYPGQSEHQTGLAMDVTSASVKYDLVDSFGDTVEGKWLSEHAAEFGFIIRYPKGKENITGYNYEPWHVRYVGKEVAKYIMSNNITFEEYFGVKGV